MLLALCRLRVSSPARARGTTLPGQSFYAGMGGHHFLPSWVRLSILVHWRSVCSLTAMTHRGSPGRRGCRVKEVAEKQNLLPPPVSPLFDSRGQRS